VLEARTEPRPPRGSDGASPSRRMGQDQPGEPVALGMLLMTTTRLIVRANPVAKPRAQPGARSAVGRFRAGSGFLSLKSRAASRS
jgi:hypothetical protein